MYSILVRVPRAVLGESVGVFGLLPWSCMCCRWNRRTDTIQMCAVIIWHITSANLLRSATVLDMQICGPNSHVKRRNYPQELPDWFRPAMLNTCLTALQYATSDYCYVSIIHRHTNLWSENLKTKLLAIYRHYFITHKCQNRSLSNKPNRSPILIVLKTKQNVTKVTKENISNLHNNDYCNAIYYSKHGTVALSGLN